MTLQLYKVLFVVWHFTRGLWSTFTLAMTFINIFLLFLLHRLAHTQMNPQHTQEDYHGKVYWSIVKTGKVLFTSNTINEEVACNGFRFSKDRRMSVIPTTRVVSPIPLLNTILAQQMCYWWQKANCWETNMLASFGESLKIYIMTFCGFVRLKLNLS